MLAAMRWAGIVAVLAALASTPGHAQDVVTLPVGNYADFATSTSDASLTDPDDPVMRKWVDNNIENIVTVVTIKRSESLATVNFVSARMTFNIPLGWYAMDDGERGAAFTADEDVRIIARQLDLEFEGVPTIEEYAGLKRAVQQQRAPTARIFERRLSTGQMMNVYQAVPARPNDNGPREIFEVLTAHPSDPKRAHQILLGFPDGQGDKYLPLLGLIMRDRQIDWH